MDVYCHQLVHYRYRCICHKRECDPVRRYPPNGDSRLRAPRVVQIIPPMSQAPVTPPVAAPVSTTQLLLRWRLIPDAYTAAARVKARAHAAATAAPVAVAATDAPAAVDGSDVPVGSILPFALTPGRIDPNDNILAWAGITRVHDSFEDNLVNTGKVKGRGNGRSRGARRARSKDIRGKRKVRGNGKGRGKGKGKGSGNGRKHGARTGRSGGGK